MGGAMLVLQNWPYALVALSAAVLCCGLAIYAWRRRAMQGASEFALLMTAVAWMNVTGAVEALISAHSLDAKILASKLYLIGGVSVPLLALFFIARYTGRDRWLTRPVRLLLWSVAGFELLLAFTNDWHHLYWSGFAVTSPAPTALVVFEHSTLNHLLAAYTYGLTAASIGLLLAHALRAPAIYRRQSFVMVLAMAAPALPNLLYYLGIMPWPGLDFTPVGFVIMGFLLTWAIFRFQLVALAPVAQDALFASLGDGVIALNAQGLVVAANPAAQELLGLDEGDLLGTAVHSLPRPWAGVLAGDEAVDELRIGIEPSAQAIEISRAAMTDHRGRAVGSILLFHDVTAFRTLQAELEHLNAELEVRVALRTAELSATVTQLETEVTERRRAEQSLRAMQESLADHVTDLSGQLSALYEVILLGGKTLEVGEIRRLTLETIQDSLHADAGFIFTYLPSTRRLELVAAAGLSPAQRARLAQAPAEWLIADTIPRTILNLAGAEDLPEPLRLPEMQAILCTAVFRNDAPLGAVGVFWRTTPSLSVEDIALFRALSDQLVVLAENARLRRAQEQALVEEERRRLARDLHDSVTQSLYALTLSADTAAGRVRKGQYDRLEELLAQIATGSHQALREIRLLLFELRLATPETMPLDEALQLRLDAVERRAGIDAQLHYDLPASLPSTLARELYWIAMEALNNALKHAAADTVTVAVSQTDGVVALVVADNGAGLARQEAPSGGMGLRTMTERAVRAGGKLSITTPPAGGVCVTVQIPVRGDRPNPDNSQPIPSKEVM